MSDDLQIQVQRELESHGGKIAALERELCHMKKILYAIIAVSLGSPHLAAIGEVLKQLV